MAHKWPQIATRPDVRFGSLADICSAQAGVRKACKNFSALLRAELIEAGLLLSQSVIRRNC